MSEAEYGPKTGFGDDTFSSAKFGILYSKDEFPQWESELSRQSFDMATITTGGVRRVSQIMGRLPATVSWNLYFESLRDYDYMDAFVGTRETLRYTYGITSNLDGRLETISGHDYLALPETLLLGLSNPVIAVGGRVEAVATFERAVGDRSYFGVTRFSEDPE